MPATGVWPSQGTVTTIPIEYVLYVNYIMLQVECKMHVGMTCCHYGVVIASGVVGGGRSGGLSPLLKFHVDLPPYNFCIILNENVGRAKQVNPPPPHP